MKKLALTLTLVLGVIFGAVAQKVGHVNYQDILVSMPGYKIAQQDFRAYVGTLEKELEEQKANLQAMVDKYLADEAAGVLSETTISLRQQEIQDKQQRIEQAAGLYQQDMTDKEEALMTPMLEEIEVAIKAVAKANGIAYVFDISQGQLLYWDGGEDLGAKVKKQLGIPETSE